MKCLSLDLSGSNKAFSLASYWYAKHLMEQKDAEDFWVMLRGGCLEDDRMSFTPPSGANTDHIVFVGTPLEVLKFTNQYKGADLRIDLFALGITPMTPPTSDKMLADIHTIYALPETSQWLRSCGVSRVNEVRPYDGMDGGVFDRSDVDLMKIAIFGIDLRWKFEFPHEYLPVDWKVSRDGSHMTREVIDAFDVKRIAAESDVLIADSNMLDDPIRHIFAENGVVCVSPTPSKDLQDRLIAAARHGRDGTFNYLASVRSPIGEDDRKVMDKASVKDVKLGIVIPFGGLDPKGLRATLKNIVRFAPEDSHVVLSHQEVVGVSDKDEYEGVLSAADATGITVVSHKSDEVFRLGIARNEGVAELPSDTSHIVFLDSDVRIDPRFFSMVDEEVRRRGITTLVPYVRNSNGSIRIGSGLAIYSYDVFNLVGGFSDQFAGWGCEDLELIHRLRSTLGIPATLIGTPAIPLVHHIDHEERWKDTRDANYDLWLRLSKEVE